MSALRKKPRGTAIDRVPMKAFVAPRTRAKLERIAAATGWAKAPTLDMLLDNIDNDALAAGSPPAPAPDRGPLYLEVAPRTRARVKALSSPQISQGQVLDMLLDSIEVNASGRPAFYEGRLPSDMNQELPYASTA